MLLGSALNIFMLYWLVLAHCTQFVGIYDLASSSLCYVYVFYLIKNFHTTFFSFSPLLLFVGIYDQASSRQEIRAGKNLVLTCRAQVDTFHFILLHIDITRSSKMHR